MQKVGNMEIVLELKGHCIETVSKKTYERLLHLYFAKSTSDNNKPVLENRIEGLRFFIEKADFRDLRNSYAELNGDQNLTVVLQIPQDPFQMNISTENKNISPKWNSPK